MRLARWNDVTIIEERKVADFVDRRLSTNSPNIDILAIASISNTHIRSRNVQTFQQAYENVGFIAI